jgi:hypothetical protein
LGLVVIPFVKGVRRVFRYIGNWYNIWTVFKTSHNVRCALVKIRPDQVLWALDTVSVAYPVNAVGAILGK